MLELLGLLFRESTPTYSESEGSSRYIPVVYDDRDEEPDCYYQDGYFDGEC